MAKSKLFAKVENDLCVLNLRMLFLIDEAEKALESLSAGKTIGEEGERATLCLQYLRNANAHLSECLRYLRIAKTYKDS